jgi:hypothetical protein
MVTLLNMANWQENEWIWQNKKFKCEPGQFVTSVESIKKNCGKGVTTKQIRLALTQLAEMFEFLAIETTNTGSLITIINWDVYQSDDDTKGKQKDNQRANGGQTEGKRRATNEESKEIQERKEVKTYTSCPHKKIIDLYHEILPELPPVKSWSNQNAKQLSARWKSKAEYRDLEWWAWFFKKIKSSDFLMGRVKSFQASLRWITKAENFAKILNDEYRNRGNGQIRPETYSQCLDVERRSRAMRILEKEGYHGTDTTERRPIQIESGVSVCEADRS